MKQQGRHVAPLDHFSYPDFDAVSFCSTIYHTQGEHSNHYTTDVGFFCNGPEQDTNTALK
jgi:hypothetical protein